MMFVLRSTLEGEQLRRMAAESQAAYWQRRYETQCTYADNERKGRLFHKEHAARLGESRDYWRTKYEEANAKLADLQKPKRDAGAQAFDNIVRHVSTKPRYSGGMVDADFTALELRVLAHYGLTATYGGTLASARKVVYEGHAAEGGLQKHSIGEEYPFIVYGQESATFGTVWRILDSRTGWTHFESFRSSQAASRVVSRFLANNTGVNRDGFTYNRSK